MSIILNSNCYLILIDIIFCNLQTIQIIYHNNLILTKSIFFLHFVQIWTRAQNNCSKVYHNFYVNEHNLMWITWITSLTTYFRTIFIHKVIHIIHINVGNYE